MPKDKNGAPLPVPPGGYGPYHIGRGNNRPGIGPGTGWNGIWDFDHFQPGEGDSLMGWWPVARPYQSGDSQDPNDFRRPFYALDYGNQGNYVINQGAPKRTFGVTGYWHRDRGNGLAAFSDTGAVESGPNVEWVPLGGQASAWCGLRAHGDLTHVDGTEYGGTGNPFNQSVLEYNGNNAFSQFGSISIGGTDKNYPGYGSQWDQLLYRDVTLAAGADLEISFKYVHALSRVRGGSNTQRTGYFWKDPIKRPGFSGGDGNFVSAALAEASGGGPVDSFTVYLGVPVEPVPGALNDYVASDGSAREIFDPQRRWYSEVIRTNGPLIRLLSASGSSGDPPPGQPAVAQEFHTLVPNAGVLANLIAQGGGRVRVVFRVKTNRGNDDEDYAISGFRSRTRGAAIVDDVLANGWTATEGDFESAASIDNRVEVPATAAWKSTGRPPGIYPHVHSVDPSSPGAAVWNDPCSPPVLNDLRSPNRTCSMLGNVLSGGDHDNAEKPGGLFGANDQDRARVVASPTIPLTTADDPSLYSAVGLNHDIVTGANEYALWMDIHTAGFSGAANSNFYSLGVQAYPAQQRNGAKVWGEVRFPTSITFSTAPTCRSFIRALKSVGLVTTSNPNGIPDSVRVYFLYLSRCFNAFEPFNCSPTTGANVGQYIDNLSLALITAQPQLGLSAFQWDWFADAFPASRTTSFASASFDTTSALIKSALNIAPLTALSRPNVPGDSAIVSTGLVPGVRVDLVFRILPGVGNYVQIGNRSSGLRRVPTSTARAIASAGSSNFWESYMADNGAFGSKPSRHTADTWDPNTWNSARMDTVESNVFPSLSLSANLPGLDPSRWMTTYHEQDPRYVTLGIAKNRCFVVDPSVGRTIGCRSRTSTSIADCNLICGPHPVSSEFPPLWTEDIGAGVVPSENGLPPGKTYEFTKILPDGQLTPGAHVQYFYRREPGEAQAADIYPDTNQVFSGNQADGQRWYHFSVLPDRWKDPAFGAGGTGMASMLVVDVHDRGGDEFFWVSAADSIGLTSSAKRGSHNGWTAAGGVNTQGSFDQASPRADNGGQAGSVWDLWNVHAGDSQSTGGAWLSSRYAVQPGASELIAGKESRLGPSPEMLRQFYRDLVIMTGTLATQFFGRAGNRTDDDFAMLNDFVGGPPASRAVYAIGSGFALDLLSGPTGGLEFLANYFGARFRSTSYRQLSGNTNPIYAYEPVPGSAFDLAGSTCGLEGAQLAVRNACDMQHGVLSPAPEVPAATAQIRYQNVGTQGPYDAAILAPAGGARTFTTLLDGAGIQRIGSPAAVPALGREGFRVYLLKALAVTFGTLACGPQGNPVVLGDVPGSGSAFVNWLGLRSANPARAREARVAFTLATTERVKVRIYDLAGRRVRTIADRVFAAGQEHVVVWDGADAEGGTVSSGIYFYRVESDSWIDQRKLTWLAP